MQVYAVGAPVRDELLDLPVSRRRWVIVGATADQAAAAGYAPDPHCDGRFLHPRTGEPCTLAWAERSAPDHVGTLVIQDPSVTLEQDLARRDLTINAMARDAAGVLIDPYGGREDLSEGALRHVTPRFAAHPEYLLSVAQHAALLGHWGFHVTHATYGLMKRMVRDGALEAVAPGAFWRACSRALDHPLPSQFFRVLERCGALERLSPELNRRCGTTAAHGAMPGALQILDKSPAGERLAALYHALGTDAPAVFRALGVPDSRSRA